MSYELRIWDPARHAPLPASAGEALETMERLIAMSDTRNSTLEKFGALLVQRSEAAVPETRSEGGLEAFWGSNPRESAARCRTAVYQLSLPSDDGTAQIWCAVAAAAECGLIVFDDETGVCFLPDGTIFPEDMREMWESTFADLKAGPREPGTSAPDSRTLLQKIGGELLDAIGRGNNHQ